MVIILMFLSLSYMTSKFVDEFLPRRGGWGRSFWRKRIGVKSSKHKKHDKEE